MTEDSSDDQHKQDRYPIHRMLNQIGVYETHAAANLDCDRPCFHLRARPMRKNPIAAMRMTVIQLVTFHVRMTSLSIESPELMDEVTQEL